MAKACLTSLRHREASSLGFRIGFAQSAGALVILALAMGAAGTIAQAQVGRDRASASPHEKVAAAAATSHFILGRRPFVAASSWNTRIPADTTFVPVAWPTSTGYNFGVTWSNYSPSIYTSSEVDPVVTVAYPAGWGYKGGELRIRMPLAADGAAGTDGELLVIDGSTVHNFWQFSRLSPNSGWAKSYGAADALTGTGWGSKQPALGAGIVAAGASQLAGLLVQAESDRGEIEHALQLCVDAELVKPGFTGEAISGDGSSSHGILQIGERLAIPPGVPMPRRLSRLGQKVFRAYQNYGAFVVDVAVGSTNLRAQANGYDRETIAALQRDLLALTPLLQRVR
jgi:hypothetical protein